MQQVINSMFEKFKKVKQACSKAYNFVKKCVVNTFKFIGLNTFFIIAFSVLFFYTWLLCDFGTPIILLILLLLNYEFKGIYNETAKA